MSGHSRDVTVDPQHRRRGAVTIEQFDKQFGILTSSKTSPYLKRLNDRILRNASLQAENVEVVVINSRELITGSLPGNYVVLSRGILNRLDVESEFAFVLAHEFSHFLLDHFDEAEQQNPDNELAADALAIRLMVFAGYETTAARSALMKAYTSDSERFVGTHPSFATRLDALTRTLQRMGGTLSGTVDRRGYQEFRHELRW